MEQDYLSIKAYDYATINTTVRADYSPWKVNMTLDGTDAMQFAPVEDSDSKVNAFVWDLSRNGDLVVDYVDKETYHPLKINIFKLDD